MIDTDGNLPIIISTRFSVAREKLLSHFRLGKQTSSKEALQSKLFEPKRLDIRSEIFGISLRNIDSYLKKEDSAQVIHQITTSIDLPDPWAQLLDAWAAKYPWIQVIKLAWDDTTSRMQLVQTALDRLDPKGDTRFAWVRLDDDDLLSPSFFDSLSAFNKNAFLGFVYSPSFGFCGEWDPVHSCYRRFARSNTAKFTAGLSAIGAIRRGKIVLPSLGDHITVDQRELVILDGRKPLTLRSLTENNDVALDKNPKDQETFRDRLFTDRHVSFDHVSEHFDLTRDPDVDRFLQSV